MANFLRNIISGQKPQSSAVPDDAGFADFPGAPSPEPASLSASPTSGASPLFGAASTGAPTVPYTKWYRVWERTTIADFYQEMFILPLIFVVIVVHVWGMRANRRKAKQWIATHAPLLQAEFAVVGFGRRQTPTVDEVQQLGALKAEGADHLAVPEEMLRENAANEFVSYATGRQNVAFVDVKLTLHKRYNPLIMFGEAVLGFFLESMPATAERVEATLYAFDGNESQLAQQPKGEEQKKVPSSTYDPCVFAVVNKDMMKRFREDRYDLSLTSTRDHAKLPPWATVMTESAEIAETCLTPDLIKAITEVGDSLDAFVISDQPEDRPKKLQETTPRKRVFLSLRLSHTTPEASQNLFKVFLRYADFLVSQQGAHFRPEVLRKVRQTREAEANKLRKLDEDGKAEERKLESDRKKKEKRDKELRGMSADEQRKFLEKEKEKEQRKSQKRMTMRA